MNAFDVNSGFMYVLAVIMITFVVSQSVFF